MCTVHSELVDWRLDPNHWYEPADIEDSVSDRLRGLMKSLGVETGTFDLRYSKDGNLFFFEVNPAGQFLYLERYGFPNIGYEFAEFLARPY